MHTRSRHLGYFALATSLLCGSLSPLVPRARAQDGTWSRLPATVGVHYHSVIRDPVRDHLILFGGTGANGNSNDAFVLDLASAPGWTLMDASAGPRPIERNAHSAVYDPVRDRMIVFGGMALGGVRNDVWALPLSGPPVWTQLTPAGTPPAARWGATAIYDPIRDRVIVMGGNTSAVKLNDVWELSLSGTPTWTPLAPTGTPPSVRFGHTAIYDAANDRMVVFGGTASSPNNQLWALTLAGTPAWIPLTAGGAPPAARYAQAAEYDAANQRMLMFGGYDGTLNHNDVWQLTLSGSPAWSLLGASGPPPAVRAGAPWVIDAPRNRLVLFGGLTDAGDKDDLWSLSLAGAPQWQSELGPSTTAPWRYEHPAVLDPATHRMYVIGGFNGSFMNDVFAFELQGFPLWTPITPLGTKPAGRHSHSATYDPLRNRIIIIGGIASSSGTTPNDVWALSLTPPQTWTKLVPAGTPPNPLYSHTAVYDPVHDRIVGYGGSLTTNSIWSLSLAGGGTWSVLTPSGTPPPPRSGHTAIYDPARGRMVVCAGYGPFGNPYSDLWELSLGDSPVWTQLPFPNSFRRSNPSAVYDDASDQMLLFGGYNGATVPMNDVWAVPLGAPSGAAPLSLGGALPPARASHSAVFDPVSRRMLVFGGFSASAQVNSDVYALELPAVLSAPPLPAGTSLRLAPAYPDPAPGHVTIEFALAASAHASLRVYDVAGRTVRTLVDGALVAGPHRIAWDRLDDQGAPADAGLYFYELRTGRGRVTGRVALIR